MNVASRPLHEGRLLLVTGGFQVGGTERHLSLVLPALQQRGWHIRIATLGEDGPMRAPIREAGIPVEDLRAQYVTGLPKLRVIEGLCFQINSLRRLIAQFEPNLVHCFLSEPSIAGTAAARLLGFHPLIVSKRNLLRRPQAFAAEKRLERWALKAADHVLGNSTQVINEMRGIGVAANRLTLIRNGIAKPDAITESEKDALRTELGWPEDSVVLLVLANLIPYKGHVDLLRALGNPLLSGTRQWCAVLAGSGPEDFTCELRRLSAELNIADRVHFMGQRSDSSKLAAAADIGILPSHHEGSSNALIEYMAAGLPVVATAVGGNIDAVSDGKNGLLVPAQDPVSLASAIATLLDAPDRRKSFGDCSKTRFDRFYSIEACVDAYHAFYCDLLGRQPEPHPQRNARPPSATLHG